MTPEEFQRLKNAEKEHLKKLKELKQAVRVLERQKKIQSELEKMSRASDDALQAQSDAVERLALETAHQEARLDVAMDSVETPDPKLSDEALESELRTARAQALVERLKNSMDDESDAAPNPAGSAEVSSASAVPHRSREPGPSKTASKSGITAQDSGDRTAEKAAENPTKEGRPEKTIGRM